MLSTEITFINLQGLVQPYNGGINLRHNKNTLEAKLEQNFHDHKAFLFGCSTHAVDMTTFPMGELINCSLFSCCIILTFRHQI